MVVPPRRALCQAAFTLLEVIVVVTLIGLLCAIAIPAFRMLKQRSIITTINNDLRVASGAIEYYAFEQGAWPPDGAGSWPAELTGYLPPPDRWNRPTPIGGTWSWALNTDNTIAALRINNFTASTSQVVDLDEMTDDGDLATGKLFTSGQSLIYVLQK